MVQKIKEEAEKTNAVIICKTENKAMYDNFDILEMGKTLEEISRNIFMLLRKGDTLKKDLILIEGVEPEGLGLAIMNRLLRACGHHYIEN